MVGCENVPTVFISHRSLDLVEAERLASELAARGHPVWLDSNQLAVGDSIVEKMNAGLDSSVYLVLCLLRSALTRPGPLESGCLLSLARQMNGANVKVIPAKLPNGIVPAILADIKYADLEA